MKLSMIIEIPNYDPLNLPRQRPQISGLEFEDDIHPEAQELIDQLKKARSQLDIHSIIWEKAIEYYRQGFSAD